MKYRDLRDFVAQLEQMGDLRRVREPVSPQLEMTALSDRVLRAGGPALWFEQPTGHSVAVLANLFGTTRRVALGMGAANVQELRDVGTLLARLKEPEPPQGLKDTGRLLQMVKAVWDMKPVRRRDGPCREVELRGDDVDLGRWPVQTCWPGDVGPLITWGLVVTRGPQEGVARPRLRQNIGIYRQQVIGRREVIMRWLAHRGGALDFREFTQVHPGQPFPLAVALGADPATTLGAVTPVPDSLSEYQFAGLLRGSATDLVDCEVGEAGRPLQVPATSEIVLEGHIPTAAAGYAGHSQGGVPLQGAALAQVLASDPAGPDAQAAFYRPVLLRGHWLPQYTVYLDNRPMDGRRGFFVFTPFQLHGAPATVMVQRGWIPRNFQDRSVLAPVETPAGEVELSGHLAPEPEPVYSLGGDQPGTGFLRIRQNLGLGAFRIETGLPLAALVVVQQGPASDGLLRDWAPVSLGVEKNYGYAFQWFALCGLILGLYVWFQFVRPRRRRA
mgnify:CR=1 FL=1